MRIVIVGLISVVVVVLIQASQLHGAIRFYWTNCAGERSVYRGNSDGSMQEVVFAGSSTGTGHATHISIHEATQQLYTYGYMSLDGPGFVKRSNLDGSGLAPVIEGGLWTLQYGFDIDQTNDRMYMGSSYPWRRSNLDGSGLITLPNPTGVTYTHDIEVDGSSSTVFFTQDEAGLFSMDLDGNNLQMLASPSHAFGLALDLENDRFFYSTCDQGQSFGTNGDIFSFDLLSRTSTLVQSGIAALDLELDAESRTLYAITNTEIKALSLVTGDVHSLFALPEQSTLDADLEIYSDNAVPAPSSLACLVGIGVMVAGWELRRKRRRQ